MRARPARLHAQAAQAVRRLHPAGPRPRQLGRLVVGRQARVGLRAGGPADAAEEPPLRHLQERRTPPPLGLRPGDHGLGLAGPAHQPPELLVDRAGHQADLHRARTSTTPTPSTPTSGSPSCPTPTRPSTWPSPTSGSRTAPTTRSTSRPTPTAWTSSRTTSWAARTASPRAPSGPRPSPASPRASSRPWPTEWASKRTTIVIGNGGPGIRGPYATEPARLQVLCLAMQGLGKPGCNQSKMIEWGLLDNFEQVSPPAPSVMTNLYAAYTGQHPDGHQPPLVHPQEPHPQSHPRGSGRVVRQRAASSPPARTSSSTTSTRPRAAPRST